MVTEQRYSADTWVEPATLDEADERLAEIEIEVREINAQLADRDRQVSGERMEGVEYWQWRRRAEWARTCRLNERDRLNASRRRMKRAMHEGKGADVGEQMAVMHALYAMCRVVNGAKVEWHLYSPSEQMALQRAKELLYAAGVRDEQCGI
jgi:hypothetical protein